MVWKVEWNQCEQSITRLGLKADDCKMPEPGLDAESRSPPGGEGADREEDHCRRREAEKQ